MKHIIELYRRDMPIKATFYLLMGICSIGIIIVGITNMIIAGILMGLFFAYLNFSLLPSLSIEKFEEKATNKDNIKSNKSNTYNVNTNIEKTNNPDENVTHSTSSDRKYSYKGLVTVEELSDDYVKLKYKDGKYVYEIPQSTPITLEALPIKDRAGDKPSKYAKEMMLEAFKDFKPKTREGDNRHIIKLDNYDMYDYDKNDVTYFKILDEKYVSKLPEDIRGSLVTYLRVKATRKYTKDAGDGMICCCIELGNLENTYIFEDEFRVSLEMYEAAEIGKEYVLIKYGLCCDNDCKLYESDFFD